jgi:hypothetical protein
MKRKFHTTRRTRIVKKNQTRGGYSLSDVGNFLSRINPVKAIGRLLNRNGSHHTTHQPSATAARPARVEQDIVAAKLNELEALLDHTHT